jgi:hypothetical protein
MSFAQKDPLDRIQHILLPTIEKNFIENERKMPILDIFFGAVTTYVTTQYNAKSDFEDNLKMNDRFLNCLNKSHSGECF